MKEIATWLASGRDYQAGVQLYLLFGSSAVIKQVLSKSDTAFNRNKLLQELVKLSNSSAEIIQEKKSQNVTGIYVEADYHQLPAEMKGLITKAKSIYKNIGAIHGKVYTHIESALQMKDYTAQQKYLDERNVGDLVNTILDLDQEREIILEQIDYFKEHKKFPDKPKPIDQAVLEMSEGAIRARLSQLRPQISKQKGNPLRAADVALWTREKDLLERRLDELV